MAVEAEVDVIKKIFRRKKRKKLANFSTNHLKLSQKEYQNVYQDSMKRE